jgi:HAE1 family hydrophobic/amphiphilic exporter-1
MPDKSLTPIVIFSVLVLLFARRATRTAMGRPALVGLLALAGVIWGIISLLGLPVELMPNVASETISVTVSVRGGMAPPDVEARIARPLEEALGDVPHLVDLAASAKKDRCIISLTLEPGADMKAASAQVHERMEKALSHLPPEIEKPVIAHYDEADAPIYIAALVSDRLSPEDLRRLVDETIKDRLLRVPGVANVEVGGGRERKILVEVDRDRLQAHRLSLRRIVTALGRRNVAMQVGNWSGGDRTAPVRIIGSYRSLEEMRRTLIARDANGASLNLGQVASVSDSYLEPESLSRLDGQSAVSIYVQKESSANALAAARGVDRALEKAWRDLPPSRRAGLRTIVVSNQAEGIEAAMASARMALWTGVVLIVLVVSVGLVESDRVKRISGGILGGLLGALALSSFIGLDPAYLEIPLALLLAGLVAWSIKEKPLRPAFIVAGTIPLSAFYCFILFRASGVSLNVMSLFGLALGMGLVVDNAVVVYENILRRRSERPGDSPDRIARSATEEMVLPLIGATATNAASFVPFLFLSKKLQLTYTDVAAAVGAGLFASLAIALTGVPLLTRSMALGPEKTSSQPLLPTVWGRALRVVKSLFHRLDPIVRWLVGPHHTDDSEPPALRPGMVPLAFIFLFIGVWIAAGPATAKWVLAAAATAAVGAGLWFLPRYEALWPALMAHRKAVTGAALALAVASGAVFTGALERDFDTGGALDEFVIFFELSSGAKMTISDAVVKDAEKRLRNDRLTSRCVKTLVSRVEGWSSKIYITLKPASRRPLSTEKAMDHMRSLLADVGRDQDSNAFVHFSGARAGDEIAVRLSGPEYSMLERLAQEITSRLDKIPGLSDVKMRYRPGRPEMEVKVNPVRAALAGLSVEEIAESAHGLLRGLRATLFRQGSSQIETIVRLRAPDRETLRVIGDVPLLTPRGERLRLTDVAEFAMGRMPNEIFRRDKQREIQITANRAGISLGRAGKEIQKALDSMTFPLDYSAGVEGDFEELSRGMRQMTWGLLAMVALVYLTLVALFESLLQPLLIMATVPLCLVGAAWGLSLFSLPLSTGALVGLMMLGGIVVNNAIMLLDKFNTLHGVDTAEALRQAALARRRPILLTASSAILGFLPMMLDPTPSGALWRPLAVTMVFGLLSSTVFTLYVVPSLGSVLLSPHRPVFFEKFWRRIFAPSCYNTPRL